MAQNFAHDGIYLPLKAVLHALRTLRRNAAVVGGAATNDLGAAVMEAFKIRAALVLKALCLICRQIEHHAVGGSVLHQRIGVEIIMLVAVGGVLVIRDLLLPDDHLVVGGVNRAPWA